MPKGDFEKERQDFIESSKKPYYPYAWELDGHPAMRRASIRRLRHPWRWTRDDWTRSIVVLVAVVGTLALTLGVAWLLQTP